MEEKILNCFPEALFEELGNAFAEPIIDRLNNLFKKREIPYKFVQDEETLEFYAIQIER